tara:strand:+ start:317 stop:1636 length:1320 start_codon:yes stop_codon:yes gene_type:complete
MKKISFFLILSVFFLLLYVFYKSEIFYQGSKPHYYSPYYKILFSSLICSIAIYFFPEKIRIYSLIIIFSIILGGYAYEVFLTYKYYTKDKISKTKEKIYFEKFGKKFDKRSIIEIYDDLKDEQYIVSADNVGYFLEQENENLEFYPFAGVSNKKTILCNENGYYSTYLSDRYGFNNPDKEWDNDEIEYLLLGDSFTQGSCVNRPFDIASNLRRLSKKPVINLGMGGSGTLLEYAIYREYAPKKVKNVVLLFFDGNDVKDLKRELDSIILKKYLSDKNYSQNLKEKQDQINEKIIAHIKNKYNFISKNSKSEKNFENIIKLVKLYRTRLQIFKPVMKIPNEMEEILTSLREITTKNKSNFFIVYLYGHEKYSSMNYKAQNSIDIKYLAKKLDITLLDMDKLVFSKEKNPLNLFPFKMYGHYNAEGYQKISEAIFKSLKSF